MRSKDRSIHQEIYTQYQWAVVVGVDPLGRYHVSTLQPTSVHSINFSEDGKLLAIAFEGGYEVWRMFPLGLVRRRKLNGTLVRAVLVPSSPLLVLQGGGTSPLYPPNKAVIYHDGLGRPVAELEFGERIRGIAVRQSTICVVLSRKTLGFEYGPSSPTPVNGKGKEKDGGKGFWIRKFGEWETAENEFGLIALSTAHNSSLLVLPGRQPGHVQLIHLPHVSLSRTAPFRPIILAHDHPLSTLSCTPDGSAIITTSERGTLVRVWDTRSGGKLRELRRGVDRAEMWGTGFEPLGITAEGDLGRVVGWSDKGTIHVWATTPPESKPTPSLTHLLSRNLPLPKYFSSPASIAQYHLPRKNPHAFSSVIGAAADAAGVPSAKLSQPNGDDDELSERFIVGWVDVPIERQPEIDATTTRLKSPTTKVDGSGTPQISIAIGNREERRSFGSEDTSRTATPTFSRHSSGGPRHHRYPSFPDHQSPSSDTPSRTLRHDPTLKPASTTLDTGRPGIEKQLVAITYSGDYYRLRIPRRETEDGEDGGSKKKCELVEYRRLKVGGGGW